MERIGADSEGAAVRIEPKKRTAVVDIKNSELKLKRQKSDPKREVFDLFTLIFILSGFGPLGNRGRARWAAGRMLALLALDLRHCRDERPKALLRLRAAARDNRGVAKSGQARGNQAKKERKHGMGNWKGSPG